MHCFSCVFSGKKILTLYYHGNNL